MARIRSTKPEFWSDLALARLSRDARLLYMALWNHADEHGRLNGDPRWIKGHCLPYDDDLNLARINELLEELERAGKLRRYVVDHVPYLFLPKLAKHQRLEPEKVPSRLPSPDEDESERDRDSSPYGADKSARDADESEPIVALQVAGGREQVTPTGGALAPRSDDVELSLNGGRVISAWIDRCAQRPPGDVIGHVGKHVKKLLAESFAPDAIGAGLDEMTAKGLHPSTLPSVVHGLVNGGTTTKPSTTDQRVSGALALADRLEASE